MLNVAYTMHRGKICRQQQDCLLIADTVYQQNVLPITTLSLAAGDVFLGVADGVAASGGNRRIAPQQASRIVLEELVRAVRDHPEWRYDGFVANRHIRLVQGRLADKLASNPKTFGTASTIAIVHIRDRQAAILNVGDSRVYQVKQNGQWQRLSKDHTVLQSLIDRGEAKPDREYAALYGALEHVLCADHDEGDFAIHRVIVALEHGDTLVLCSDGIHDEIGEDKMWNLFDPVLDVEAQTRVWRDAAWRAGAGDNLSLVVARSDDSVLREDQACFNFQDAEV
ncbi:MAG: SpoIIE family protein phosphatase [Candidatus Competibacteraceae bacterium]|nr:SpoIIE family protein phosphatase [Candidatus Competibacteraceae bacterium]